MALRLTKTSKVVFALSIVLLSGALGYLIWRVNQPETVAPEESEAGGGGDGGGCCLPVEFNGQLICPYGSGSTACQNGSSCCGATEGLNCGGDTFCTGEMQYLCAPGSSGVYNADTPACSCTTCYPTTGCCYTYAFLGYPDDCTDCTDVDAECGGGSDCEPCRFPDVGFCIAGECVCKPWDTDVQVPCVDLDSGDTFTCEAKCPTGMIKCDADDTGCTQYRKDCVCPICSNKTYDTILCKEEEVIERPNLCDRTTISKTVLSEGQSTTITAYVIPSADYFLYAIYNMDNLFDNGTPKPVCVADPTGASPSTECPTGTKKLVYVQEKDSLVTSSSYTFTTSQLFVNDLNWDNQQAEEVKISVYVKIGDGLISNPDADCQEIVSLSPTVITTAPVWEIEKKVVEVCLDEDTEDPQAELSYSIKITNTGTASGTISKIEDVLDEKVESDDVQTSTITTPGVYSSGKITWDYTSSPLTFATGQVRSYTYKLLLDKDEFDTYANIVTLYPVGSSPISADAQIDADCVITEEPEEPEEPVQPDEEIPQTGILDTTLGRLAVGFALVIIGAVVYNLPNSVFRQKEVSYKYRDRFERKVDNR